MTSQIIRTLLRNLIVFQIARHRTSPLACSHASRNPVASDVKWIARAGQIPQTQAAEDRTSCEAAMGGERALPSGRMVVAKLAPHQPIIEMEAASFVA